MDTYSRVEALLDNCSRMSKAFVATSVMRIRWWQYRRQTEILVQQVTIARQMCADNVDKLWGFFHI